MPKPADFGTGAEKSADVALDGWGDSTGYHLELGRENSGFAWNEVALLRPAGRDESSWTGYQCLSGDGRFAAVAILPASAVNQQAARDHGAFAYAVDLTSGAVRPLATGVGLKYFSPGCGTGTKAVFTLDVGANDRDTQLLSVDLATGKIEDSTTITGQLTSAVPTDHGIVGVQGSNLVQVSGKTKPVVVAPVTGNAYELRPTTDGGLSFLQTTPGSRTASAVHTHAGTSTTLGSGDIARLHLFQGRAGRTVLTGATTVNTAELAAAGVTRVEDKSLPHGAVTSSLDGDALTGADADGQKTEPTLLATKTGKVLTPARPTTSTTASTATAAFIATASTNSAFAAQGGTPQPHGDAAPTATDNAAPNTAAATQTPVCAVPRLNAAKQAMQPNAAQVNWAIQMSEQGLLTGSAYTRPAGFANLGLAAYAPNNDFPLIPLSHPAGGSNTVPRSVYEAIVAQESNWSQASWHSPAGTAGAPLIASYYGAGGDIRSINYAASDCGYGLGQVTTGMHVGDHAYSVNGQTKIAVDYQENISAGLQILESTWNQLYTAGITANNADPKYLENWYFAAWAYNSGIQPNAANGNTTGCTPGPTCTGPDGTWGLGWTNNPDNLDYPPSRDPYLQDTYADAAHPGSWPYQERVLGWMASPLLRYSARAYATPDYHGGKTWVQPAPFASMCTTDNHCDPVATNPTTPGASHCMLNDFQCWWHQPVTWIPSCATTCATSGYAVGTGSTEPANPSKNPPTCNLDTSKVAANAIIVDDEPSRLNLQGCGSSNWTSNGTFTYTYGTNAAGDPIGAIDTHQLGTGLGGHVLFTHTEDGTEPSLINTGTWTPNLPSLQYYKIKLHIPGLGAQATNVVYTINPGGGVSPWRFRVNQAWNSEQWVTIGTFAMTGGATVVLNNNGSSVDNGGFGNSDFDVAFDAIAFVPQGGTPGQPIGGPPGIQDAPRGSNPAFVACGCARRTAGDPVDTSTGYFGDDFTDLTTPGRGLPLNFTRSYAEGIADPHGPNGSLASDGPFGWGWTYSYNLSATTDAGTGNVTVRQEDGSAVTFVNSSGSYAPSAPRYDAALVKSGSNYVYTRRGKEIYTFDAASGHLSAEMDLAGSKATPLYQTTLAYDGNGHLSTITDPAGRSYTLSWNGTHISALADQTGRQITYGYDTEGNLTDVYGAGTTRIPSTKDDDHMRYTYVAGKHLMSSMRTPKNFSGPASAVTSMTYDAAERVTAQTDANVHTTGFLYGPDGGLTAGQTLVTDPAGHKDLHTYQNGLLVSETKGYGTAAAGTTSFTYDPITLGVSTETDANGHLRTYTYDDHGNKTSASDALGFTTNYIYGDAGNLLETISPNGVATVNTYDQAGHIPAGVTGILDLTSTTVTKANNVVESTTGNFGTAPARTTDYYYDDAAHPGDRTRNVDAEGRTSTSTLDRFGNVTAIVDGEGSRSQVGYDTGRGWISSVVSPAGSAAGVVPGCTPPAKGCSTVGHDIWGNVTSTTDPLGHQVVTTFNANREKTSVTDENNRMSTTDFDPAGQATKTTQADGVADIVDYNPDGTITDTIDGASQKTAYGYDGQGRRTTWTDPANRVTSAHLDPVGNLLTMTDPSSQVSTYGYDPANQLTSVRYSDGTTPNVTYGYDPAGARVSMTDGTGSTAWDVNVFGEVTGVLRGSGAKISYGYDKTGHPTSIIYPGGPAQTVVQTYDHAGRLATVTDWNSNKTVFGYGPDGDLRTTTYPNGTLVTNGYDDSDTLTSSALTAGTVTLASLTFGRDNAHQLTSSVPTGIPGAAQSYGYSPREQLSSTTTGGATAQYTVDPADNPTGLGSATQAFDAANQLCWAQPSGAVANPACGTVPTGATKYGFDNRGNRKTMTPATGTATTYGYDQANRLTSMTGTSAASYRYDGDGLRNTKTVGSVTTAFAWGSGQLPDLLADSSWNYVYGPGGVPLEQINTSSTLWYFHDQLGSTRALIDNAGHIAGTYAYTEYGLVTHSGAAQTPLQYTGQYSDAETGFVYLRARFYDPATAQFLSVDPAYDSTGARYTYVNDDPLNNVDPSGEWGFLAVLFAVPGLGEVLAAAVAIVIVAVVVVAIIQHVSNYYASSSSNPRSGAHMPAQPPATLHGFPKAQPVPRKNGRARWEDKKRIYEWDSEKGEVECYRKSDELHLGGFDPETGVQTTKPDKGRQPGR